MKRSLFYVLLFLFLVYKCNVVYGTLADDLNGTSNAKYLTNNIVIHKGQETAQGFVRFNDGLTITQDGHGKLDTCMSFSGSIDLSETGTLELLNNLKLDAGVTFSSGGKIRGHGNTIMLSGNITIPAGKTLRFIDNTIIDGQGCNLTLGQGAKLRVDPNVTLTLKNINWFNTLTIPPIEMIGTSSQLALDNSNIFFDRDWSFTQGKLFIHNDVMFTGTKMFSYASTSTMSVAPFATCYFDVGTTFSYSPGEQRRHTLSERNNIYLTDATSGLYFDGCSLNLPDSGLQLTKGYIIFDNKITINGNTVSPDATHSFEWGNGTDDNMDLSIRTLAGSRIETNGFIYHHPA